MGEHVSPIFNPLPTPSQSYPAVLSQCTDFEFHVSCIKLGLVIYFTYEGEGGMILENSIETCILPYVNANYF